ncbi:beta-galactosidase trimerization domain-containing protein [Amycolatopsis sp. NBC_00345]|uniref:beta-galactosidase trimerization domain-containing protein n=1 Tax=Amycolatopsis sp. NBC_00345 TaxID=2975955 RepID=UPI002E26EFBD
MSRTFTVEDGRLLRHGIPHVVIGATYYPAQAGCRLWVDWDPAVLKDDFHRMAAAGLNTVRLFLFWRDAQPDGGECVSETTLDRLRAAVELAGLAGLTAVVSLFTIWMNGQLLDLPWRRGRDIWRDPDMLAAERNLARAVAETLRDQPGMLAYDLGDELWHIDPDSARSLTRAEVAGWQGTLAGVIRAASPGALVFQANDPSGVFAGRPYGSDNSQELDLVATHGFCDWAPVPIASTSSYEATNLVPFLVRASAAYGVPFVDELGSYGVAERTAARYLGAAAASALGNGAAGLVVWSWRDVSSTAEPYLDRPSERQTGLLRLDGSDRPAMTAVARVARARTALTPSRRPAQTTVYLPQRVRGQGSSYLDSGGSTIATFYAYLLLKRIHVRFDFTAQAPVGRSLIVCPSVAHLTLADLDRLRSAVADGATLYLSLGDHLHAFPGADLCGAEIVDTCVPVGKELLRWDGDTWPIDWTATRTRATELATTSAQTLARYQDGTPALTSNSYGAGRVLFTNAPIEAQLGRDGRVTGWERWYDRIAGLAGSPRPVRCSSPDVEVIALDEGMLLVNHAASAVRAVVTVAGPGGPALHVVHLDGKDWTVLPETKEQR